MTDTGLMAFWANIDSDYLHRFREWHNCEHIPERLGVPGFVEARRYVAADAPDSFLMSYATRDPGVLRSEAYLKALSSPTPWTQESLTHFRNPVRNIYRLRDDAGAGSLVSSPYLTAMRCNMSEVPAIDANDLPDEVDRLRVYELDAEASNLKTKEREIYGGGPGEELNLVMIERRLPVAPDADLATVAGEVGQRLENTARDAVIAHFWIDYAALAEGPHAEGGTTV